MTMYNSIEEIKMANIMAGGHFFSHNTIKFFDSIVESGVYLGCYFVTSEKGPDEIRKFTIRKALPDGDIVDHGKSQGYLKKADAIAEIKRIEKGGLGL